MEALNRTVLVAVALVCATALAIAFLVVRDDDPRPRAPSDIRVGPITGDPSD